MTERIAAWIIALSAEIVGVGMIVLGLFGELPGIIRGALSRPDKNRSS